MTPGKKRIQLSEFLYLAVGSAATQVALIISGIAVAHYLGHSDFGKYLFVQATVQTFLIISAFANQNSVSRLTAIYQNRDENLLLASLNYIRNINYKTTTLSSLLMTIYAIFICNKISNQSSLIIPIFLSVPSLLFLTFDLYYKGVMIAQRQNRDLAISSILSAMFLIVATFVTSATSSLQIVVFAVTISNAVQALLSRHYCRIPHRSSHPVPSLDRTLAQNLLLKYSLPMMLAGATVQPVHWIMQNWLSNQFSYEEVATFGVSIQWFTILMFGPVQLTKILLPRLSEAASAKDRAIGFAVLRTSMNISICYGIAAAGGLFVAAPYLAQAYSMHGGQLVLCLKLISFTSFLSILQSPVSAHLNSQSNAWRSFAINAVWASTYIFTGSYLLEYKTPGIIMSMTVAYVVTLALTFAWMYRANNNAKESNCD